ncbi:hypothetical protein [Xanthocytophaga agilis]|uniref:Uncharacterized protein n=1 Tax=Xanthocytophaga agilis TaxID=3048010 RepID=A0AAE3R5U5_9BACT|nr:hypothetical protein [Xanthocytophaga agilis]MDJ1504314.1 hypothetical protein [Xanthocytophaga agilis]
MAWRLPTDFLEVKQHVLQHIYQCSLSNEKQIYGWFGEYIYKLSTQGWSRWDIYRLMHDLLEEPMDEAYETDINELETSLVGNCSSECIIRLYGDPKSTELLKSYVGSGQWRMEE